jgi:hypothetical protein
MVECLKEGEQGEGDGKKKQGIKKICLSGTCGVSFIQAV